MFQIFYDNFIFVYSKHINIFFCYFNYSFQWTAREHLFLLTAIERHGYGNWEDISKAINIEMNLENKPSHSSYR